MRPEPRYPFHSYQARALAQVSRTFALTIPLLPPQVRYAIGNAYLLCRIADTIEDEPTLSVEYKREFLSRFVDVVQGLAPTSTFAHDLTPLLTAATSKSEQELVSQVGAVIDYHRELRSGQRQPIERCVKIMCEGMAEFVDTDEAGLPTMSHVERYCYFVAGVVGEMITDVLCDYSHIIDSRKTELSKLSVQFGRGLQLVNILKDHREDRIRGATWLPQSTLNVHGNGSRDNKLSVIPKIIQVVQVAQRDLEAALRYVQLIPSHESGVRRFLAVTLGLAVLTLRRIHSNPAFQTGAEAKTPRRQVYATVAATKVAVRSNSALKWLFDSVKPELTTN